MAEFFIFMSDDRVDAVPQPSPGPDSAAFLAPKQFGIHHAGINDDARRVFASLASIRVERPPLAIPGIIGLAVHVVGDAELLHANGAMLFELACPSLGEFFGMIGGIGGDVLPEGEAGRCGAGRIHAASISRFGDDGNCRHDPSRKATSLVHSIGHSIEIVIAEWVLAFVKQFSK
jgi:hypothetical protein